jgi:hypothetical protein
MALRSGRCPAHQRQTGVKMDTGRLPMSGGRNFYVCL